VASKGGREKIKLESTAGTGHFYTTSKNKKNHARENVDHEVRPESSQARAIQRNQAEVIYFDFAGFESANPYKKTRSAGFFMASLFI